MATDVKLSIEQVLKRAKGALYNLDETYVQTANLLVKHGIAHNSPVTEITL